MLFIKREEKLDNHRIIKQRLENLATKIFIDILEGAPFDIKKISTAINIENETPKIFVIISPPFYIKENLPEYIDLIRVYGRWSDKVEDYLRRISKNNSEFVIIRCEKVTEPHCLVKIFGFL